MGELRSLDEHLASCGLAILPCPNECHTEGDKIVGLFRKDVEKHTKEECPRRQFECPHCHEAGEYQERTTEHLKECPQVKIPCPNHGCQIHVERCNLSKHHKECLFEKVSCKYTDIGCKEKVLRKDLEKHEKDCLQHFQPLINTVCQQQHTIRKLENTTTEQQIKICELESKVAHLHVQLSQLSRQVPMKYMYKFKHYQEHKDKNEVVYSPPFYTSPGGYMMCICIIANGTGNARGYVSVGAYCMKGMNDDHLPWPFTGTVTVELLNQSDNKHHHSVNISITIAPDDQISQEVKEKASNSGLGLTFPCYISHAAIDDKIQKPRYLINDCLYFRISVETSKSSKTWLF